MKALLVVSEPMSGSGGLARVASLQRDILQTLGYEVDTLTPDDLGTVWQSARFPALNAHLRDLQLSCRARQMSAGHAVTFSHGNCAALPLRSRAHVHFYHGTLRGLAAACRTRLSALESLILTQFGGWLEILSGWRALRVAVSGAAQQELLARYHLGSVRVVYNGVDTDLFAPGPPEPHDGLVGLCVGRVDYGKGSETLRGLDDLLPPDCGLRIAAGGSPARGTWNPARYQWLGRIRYDDLPAAYRAADYLLCCSRYEGFGLTLLEAWACGRPVVTGKVGIVRELVGQEPSLDALVVDDVSDVRGFARCIERLRQDPELGRRQAAWGRRLVESRFSLAQWRRSNIELIGAVVPS